VWIIEGRSRLAQLLVERLRACPAVEACAVAPVDGPADRLPEQPIDTVIYAPSPAGRWRMTPDLASAAAVFRRCADARVRKVVLLSSAAVYGPNPHNTGLLGEVRLSGRQRKNRIAAAWAELEALAEKALGKLPDTHLTVLRPATVPLRDETGPLAGLFRRRLAFPLLGYDPSIQLLSPDDLVEAVCRAVEADRGGCYNLAPAGVIPLRQALRLARVKHLSLAYVAHRAARAVLAPLRLAPPAGALEYSRYSWTVSGEKAARELGFVPRHTSAEALADCLAAEGAVTPRREAVAQTYDDYGLDERYFAWMHRTLAWFLTRCYWRIEVRGLEHVPRQGPAVLVGIHRGFMPFDGFVTCHQVAEAAGRIPRFLIHPGLVKFPFLHDFMTKQGALIACNENADYALGRQDLLALYPEGVHGAFRLYREAYTLGKFGRDEYVRMALRNGAPIVPFVTLGSAEIFPILARLEWGLGWWKRYSEWPCLPITPTFPLLPPVPLPSKWHTLFLEPVQCEYPPEAAEDDVVVRAISERVRSRMAAALARMRQRRRSIFFGSIFDDEVSSWAEPACEEGRGVVAEAAETGG
jgi:1-acyl-sn-glycerol-3-phosphate acyltransferase/nucleoside-diphosphate-sugar epimerase